MTDRTPFESHSEHRSEPSENILLQRASSPGRAPLAVIFSSVNSNGFSYYKLFEKFGDRLHRIYVRDPFDAWYTKGVGGAIGTAQEMLERIDELINEVGPSRVMAFGSSMGGYAALRLAAAGRVDLCVASSPQTILDTRLPHTPRDPVPAADADLTDSLSSATCPNTVLYFGAADFVDVFNLVRVPWKSAQMIPVAGRDHLAAAFLHQKGTYYSVIEHFIRSGDAPSLKTLTAGIRLDDRCLKPVPKSLIVKIVEAFYLESGLDVVELSEELFKHRGNWADAYHICAKLLDRNRKRDKAIEYAWRAVELAPDSVTIADTYAAILVRAGQFDEAMAAYHVCLKIRPKHYSALCALADLHVRRGETQQAISFLEQAVAIRPRLPRAVDLLAKLTSGM